MDQGIPQGRCRITACLAWPGLGTGRTQTGWYSPKADKGWSQAWYPALSQINHRDALSLVHLRWRVQPFEDISGVCPPAPAPASRLEPRKVQG